MNILLIEAIHDLFIEQKFVEELWQAWKQTDIWRLPHGHASKIALRLETAGNLAVASVPH